MLFVDTLFDLYLQNKVKVISHNHHHIKIKQIVHLKEIDEKNENADETEYQEKITDNKKLQHATTSQKQTSIHVFYSLLISKLMKKIQLSERGSHKTV